MNAHSTKTRLVATAGALIVLALAAGPSSSAKSRIPELGDADPPAVEPAPKQRAASFKLIQLGPGPCGQGTFAIEVDGHRRATLC
jgi:hypothetical protein